MTPREWKNVGLIVFSALMMFYITAWAMAQKLPSKETVDVIRMIIGV